ncbi:hypothetical protein Q763_07525 [Flavobacterium beibuense F44-8]|uniref:Lipoprotein n=1 Tax=Flavobacterium beibuense F44-8 TaxID=1406840 RepID=A0A0A2LNI4_9FLAO|nr:hypothetical protein [Flavobacterium beibuense]KGO81489.1 hypothetical protein Q763_07525 [Flavobacterium beibuense F44-8]
MKKLISLLAIVSLFSCSNDDAPQENHEFLNSLVSKYKLVSVDTDVPIDLNGDNIPQTDLMLEADCFLFGSFALYMGEFVYKPSSGYKEFGLHVPCVYYDLANESYTTCLVGLSLFCFYEVNEETKEIIITGRNEEREAEFGSVTEVYWEDSLIHFIVNKELYTTNGWQEVNIHMVYQKWDFLNNVPN